GVVDPASVPAGGVKLRIGGFRRVPENQPVFTDEVATAAWPARITTDSDGAFRLTGMLPRATVHLEIKDDRYGPQWLAVTTGDGGATEAGTLKLKAPRRLDGTAVADDNGEPLGNATVRCASHNAGDAGLRGSLTVRTDAAGRFTVRPYPGGSLSLTAGGAPGTAFLAVYQTIDWPAGRSTKTVEVRVPRGVLVRGRVVEAGTGWRVAGARVQYRPTTGKNKFGRKGNLLEQWPWLDVVTDADGNFALATVPGPGHLLVRGPGHDYIPIDVSERELIDGRKGGGRAHFP